MEPGMGLFEGFLKRKRDPNFDWITLDDQLTWEEIGIDSNEGMEYSIERSGCFRGGNIVWWKQRIGLPGDAFHYVICAGSTETRAIVMPICRTLSDPGKKLTRPDVLKQTMLLGTSKLLDESFAQAEIWAEFNAYQWPPPYVFYGMSII